MNEIFEWVGFICITGCIALISALVWYKAAIYFLKGTKEFWWVCSYIAWRKGKGGQKAAKMFLIEAIEHDKNKGI